MNELEKWKHDWNLEAEKIEKALEIIDSLSKRGIWATPARVNTLDRTALMALACDFDYAIFQVRQILVTEEKGK